VTVRDVTARCVAIGTDQQQGPPAVAWQRSPDDTQDRGALIGSLQFHIVVCGLRVMGISIARQPHGFFDLAVPLVSPDQEIRDFSRIFEIASHNPSREDGHFLAVEPRPETQEMAV
jgi:hypothetical protein